MRRTRALLLAAAMLCGFVVPSFADTAKAAEAAPEAADAAAPAQAHLQALSLGRTGTAPWPYNPLWFAMLAVVVPGVLWTGLAWKRAFDTDPARRRRAGVRDLRRVITELEHSGSAAPTARQLHRWRDAVARAWTLPLATPTPLEIAQAVEALGGDAADWRSLWTAAERGLFAAGGELPSGWLAAARAAAAKIEMPRRENRVPRQRDHWLPAVLCTPLLLGAVFSGPQRAEAQQPDVAAAVAEAAQLEQAYKPSLVALRDNPMDWAAHENIARHNIVTQDWDSAVAHGLAAFLLGGAATALDNLRYAYAQTAMSDPTLKRLLAGSWYERLPTRFSPAGWQRCTLVASLLLAAGLVAAVFGLYAPGQRAPLLAVGSVTAGIGFMMIVIAGLCWSAYGDLRLPGAGILLRQANLSPVPTDLVPQDETAPIAAGRLVLHQGRFLNWERVAADGNLSGWVRANALLPLYADAWPRSTVRVVSTPPISASAPAATSAAH
jgi:hypothetical protein